MADRDFPKLPESSRGEVREGRRGDAARHDRQDLLLASRNDETRFHLNGVLFESDGKMARMVSTDGHRLSKVERRSRVGPSWRRA